MICTEYQFITDDNLREAKEKGINLSTFKERVYCLHWTIEKALNTPVRTRRERIPEYWFKVAEDNGISRRLLSKRHHRMGWDIKKAATTPVFSKEDRRAFLKKVSENRKKYEPWVYENINKNKIPMATFYARINDLNWSVEKACTTPIIPYEESLKKARETSLWYKTYKNVSHI